MRASFYFQSQSHLKAEGVDKFRIRGAFYLCTALMYYYFYGAISDISVMLQNFTV